MSLSIQIPVRVTHLEIVGIAVVEKEMAEGLFAVSASASDLLHVTLQVFGHGEMQDGSQVGLVKTHAESHRRHHDTQVTLTWGRVSI